MAVRKLLVANRGEIAVRIFRTCRELGVGTVAVAAPDDAGALHTRTADETVPISSYLDAAEHVRAAREAGADAIHPGYGFLSENADFAEAVGAAGLTWVGPPPEALRAGGDKLAAKRIAAEAGVPVVPTGAPEELGFPLLVKAAAGGGGRGMRVVRRPDELEEALAAARREAEAAFGDGTVFCERYVERPRHVEIQLLADTHGTVVALGERDCSIQRRHQKVLEESPSPALDPALRAAMSAAAVRFARAIGYVSAGTAEFMLDGRDFWFLELNGRIQVEHPVTELVTGIDLVAEQIRIAGGSRACVETTQTPVGHAVEVRLYAEDPRTFLPQAGRVERLRLPEGVRVDAGVEAGDEVGTSYDPMIAKLIAHGATRDEALSRLAAALEQTEVGGLTTNLPFLRWLVAHPVLRAGDATTAFLVEHPPLSEPPPRAAGAPWRGGWRLNLPVAAPAPPPVVDDA
ncbi:MAG TPA: biotin carboxylase N-terminal domain-containing protein, partial [Gaiellaceae bacterium]|nr:biotin carboxylase N-terminal domain-containing protein [Gaiellaceae bacterium]